jgi:hypothetical protein
MSEPQKTLKVFIGKVIRAGSSGYLVPSRHPLDQGADGTLSPAPSSPGVLIPYLRPAEVLIRDERHLALLMEDAVLKDCVVSDEKYAELAARDWSGGAGVKPTTAEADLRREVASLRADLEAAGAHYAALQEAAEAKTLACAAAEAKASELAGELAQVRARVEKDATSSQVELGDLRKQIADLGAELAATRKQVDLTKPAAPVAPPPAAAPAPTQAAPTQAKPEDKSQQGKPKRN